MNIIEPKTVAEAKQMGWPIAHLHSGLWCPLTQELIMACIGSKAEATEKVEKWARELKYFMGNYERIQIQKENKKKADEAIAKSGKTKEEIALENLKNSSPKKVQEQIKKENKKKEGGLVDKLFGKKKEK